jgi:hypothetical protein
MYAATAEAGVDFAGVQPHNKAGVKPAFSVLGSLKAKISISR